MFHGVIQKIILAVFETRCTRVIHVRKEQDKSINRDEGSCQLSHIYNIYQRTEISDGTALNEEGRAFQARAAATGNARSPSVVRRVYGTTSVGVAADRR